MGLELENLGDPLEKGRYWIPETLWPDALKWVRSLHPLTYVSWQPWESAGYISLGSRTFIPVELEATRWKLISDEEPQSKKREAAPASCVLVGETFGHLSVVVVSKVCGIQKVNDSLFRVLVDSSHWINVGFENVREILAALGADPNLATQLAAPPLAKVATNENLPE